MFSCAKTLFLVSLLFVRSSERLIPTHFLNFEFLIILVHFRIDNVVPIDLWVDFGAVIITRLFSG